MFSWASAGVLSLLPSTWGSDFGKPQNAAYRMTRSPSSALLPFSGGGSPTILTSLLEDLDEIEIILLEGGSIKRATGGGSNWIPSATIPWAQLWSGTAAGKRASPRF